MLVLLGIQAQTAKIHLAPLGSTWIHLGPPGSTWVHLDQPRSTWVHMGSIGSTCFHQTFYFSRRVDESYRGFHLIYTNMGDLAHEAHLCFSYVGRTDPDGDGKGQVVNLGSAECLTIGKILHETLHSLGWKLNRCCYIMFFSSLFRRYTRAHEMGSGWLCEDTSPKPASWSREKF